MAGILVNLRLPRVALCIFGGAILGLSGLAFQSVFRNPIAEPYVLGVSSGAAIGGSLAVVLGIFTHMATLAGPLCAGVFGIATLPLSLVLGRSKAGYSTSYLLIGGVVLGTMLAAANTLVMLLAGLDTNMVLRWLLGSAANATWSQAVLLLSVAVAGGYLLSLQATALNLISLSEQQARILGIDPERVSKITLAIATMGTALVVGCMGIVGFVGLVAPHIARRIWGTNFRNSFVGTLLIGSGLLVGADLVSQRLNEIPVGAVTALLGAPVLLFLLRARNVAY